MKYNIKTILLLLLFSFISASRLSAQEYYSLHQLIAAAKKNNHLLKIKEYQVQEKISKLNEDEIKKYPVAAIDGSYQYNFKLPDITIPAGTIGSITNLAGESQLLPAQASRFTLGEKGNYNIGLTIYQPITQQFKINTNLDIDKTDIQISQKEKAKTAIQIKLAIEQLYYSTLIAKKQAEIAIAKIKLARAKLYDLEGTLAVGKTTESNRSGLMANVAEEEQYLLKINNQIQDYLTEISMLTNLNVEKLNLKEYEEGNIWIKPIESYKTALNNNPDMQIALMNQEKANLGIRTAKQNNLPDFGLTAGYYLQQGSPILPANSPYLGVTLKWNIQDLFTYKQIKNQRLSQFRQAIENIEYTRQKVNGEIEKAWRKVKQSDALIAAAKKFVDYCKEALKEQQDKHFSGLGIKTTFLEIQLRLAQAEADWYTAKLSSAIALAELESQTAQR
ncbi:TolC family protein [Pedobacter sp. MC2016-24]|uniref:TolC family protein n=1 Tax=Pedobacter sp. MC2016-24 TaxID=2780090 RepID=UPI00187FDAB0|nr:TolC family protein [Pedobacter sp. MC2016-24]MBE9601540.1 TolC family protein [Pedobacter sp. MC2016-24]